MASLVCVANGKLNRLSGVVLGLITGIAEDVQSRDLELVRASRGVAAVGQGTVPGSRPGVARDKLDRGAQDITQVGVSAVNDFVLDERRAKGHVGNGEGLDNGGGVGVVLVQNKARVAASNRGKGGVGGQSEVAVTQNSGVVEAANDTLERNREGVTVGAVQVDVTRVDGQAGSIDGRRSDGDSNDGIGAGGNGNLVLTKGDSGGIVGDFETGEDVGVDRGGKGVCSSSADGTEVVGNILGASVGNGKVESADKVVGIVESKVGDAGDDGGVGSVESLDETTTLLGNGSENVIGTTAVVVVGRGGRGSQKSLDDGGVKGAADFGNESNDGGNEGASHGGSRNHGVRAKSLGPGGQNVATRRSDLGLDIGLKGGAPRSVGAEVSSSDGVLSRGQVDGGGLGVLKVELNLGSSSELIDPGDSLVSSNHTDGEDAINSVSSSSSGASNVVVEQNVLGAIGSSVGGLLDKGAGSTADEDNVARQIGGIGRVSITTAGSVAGVVGSGPERQVYTTPGTGLSSSVAKLLHAASIDGVVGDGEQSGRLDVVKRGNGGDLLTVGGGAGVEETIVTTVAGRDGARNTLLDDTGDDDGPGVLAPSRRSTNRGGNDLTTLVVGTEVGLNEDIVASATITTKDTVCAESDTRSGTSEAELVGLSGNDTGHVRTVTSATIIGAVKLARDETYFGKCSIHLLVIWNWSVETSVVITNKIVAVADQVARAKTTSESRVGVVNLKGQQDSFNRLSMQLTPVSMTPILMPVPTIP